MRRYGLVAVALLVAIVSRAAVGASESLFLFGAAGTTAPHNTIVDSSIEYQTDLDESLSLQVKSRLEWVFFASDDNVPPRAMDVQVKGTLGWKLTDRWDAAVAAGAGYASTNPFVDNDACYGVGQVKARYAFDDRRSLTMSLSYNGNRVILPDVPIPMIVYEERLSESFSYTIGAPRSGLIWRPTDRLVLNVALSAPFRMEALAEYELMEKQLFLFTRFDTRSNAYHRSGDDPDRRLFFTQRTLGVGVRWVPASNVSLQLTGGWALHQRLERGFDMCKTDTVETFPDGPFVGLSVLVGF